MRGGVNIYFVNKNNTGIRIRTNTIQITSESFRSLEPYLSDSKVKTFYMVSISIFLFGPNRVFNTLYGDRASITLPSKENTFGFNWPKWKTSRENFFFFQNIQAIFPPCFTNTASELPSYPRELRFEFNNVPFLHRSLVLPNIGGVPMNWILNSWPPRHTVLHNPTLFVVMCFVILSI